MPPAVNPWLALPDGGPSPATTRRLRAAHERLVTGSRARRRRRCARWSATPGAARSAAASTPTAATPPVDLLDDDLLAYREAHPLAPVMPVIRRLLVEDAEDDRMIVAVTDAAGRMLWVEGDSAAALAGGRHALRRGRPLGRGRRRHQRPRHRARRRPRRPDLRQRALPPPGAAVELLGRAGARPGHRRAARRDRRDRRRPRGQPARAHPGAGHRRGGGVGAALAAPRAAAARRRTPAARRRCRGRRRGSTVLGRERARLRLPAGPVELSLRHSELLLLLAEAAVAGEGRTAEQLAAECHPGDAAAVTVRAELSRLRRLVGPDLVGSRPYRLLGRLDTDLDQVRRLLGPRRGRRGAGALSRRGAARLPRARAWPSPASGWRRCSARPCCAAAVPSCCCATPSCPRPGTTPPCGRPASSGCRPARRAARPRPRTCCACGGARRAR